MSFLRRSGAILLGVLAAILAAARPSAAAEAPEPRIAHELAALHQRIHAGEFPNVHSVLIEQNGRRLAEWYFAGPDTRDGDRLGTVQFNPATLHDIRSVSKSVVSLLVGIALADGTIKSLDTPVLNYFPEYPDLRDAKRQKITLRHLLTMTSGLAWDEVTYPYTDKRNGESSMDAAPDRYRYILSRAVEAPPGTRWRYSGGDVALIAAVIARTTKTPIDTYVKTKLFAPLGIMHFEWVKDDKGIPYAASGLRLTPRDMLKLGELMQSGGRFGDNQLVPAQWVKQSGVRHADTWYVLSAHQVVTGDRCGLQYGYFWWIAPACNGRPAFYAGQGNGGQWIVVVPSLNAVMVITAGLYNDKRYVPETRDLIWAALDAISSSRPILRATTISKSAVVH